METTFGFAGVAGITMICYLAGLALRLSPLENKWIPLGCGVLGGALGLAGLHFMARWAWRACTSWPIFPPPT